MKITATISTGKVFGISIRWVSLLASLSRRTVWALRSSLTRGRGWACRCGRLGARESRLGGAEAARSVRLAASLESLPHAGGALSAGLISVRHAEVIATAA